MEKQLPRGMRNNNPLNIRHSASRWLGMADEQTDKDFVQFKAMRWGIRAAFIIIRTYIKQYRCDTIAKIVSRWAPTSENNTKAYIDRVVKFTGLQADKKLKFEDKTFICSIVQAMHVVECGGAFLTYMEFESGYAMAIAKNVY